MLEILKDEDTIQLDEQVQEILKLKLLCYSFILLFIISLTACNSRARAKHFNCHSAITFTDVGK